MNIPRIVPILTNTKEAHHIHTITFHDPSTILPGQFYMIWVPRVDEIPMSVSQITPKQKAITFRTIGDATTILSEMKPGSSIGIRGPYGNGFTIQGKNLLFVGGGTGVAMLAPALEQAVRQHRRSTIIIGVKTKNELFFADRLRDTGATVHIATDDGSEGFHGFASDLAAEILTKNTIDALYTCGPEPMMKQLLLLSEKIMFQASLERYMKCALGLCGQCCVGQGIRVCVEGPIFDKKTLSKIKEFGVYRRDATGRKIMF